MAVTLLLGTEKAVFALDSDDRRESWTLRGPAHKGWQAYSLFHDDRDGTVWTGLSSAIFGTHLQRSPDLGDTWLAVEGSPRFPEGSPRKLEHVWSFAKAPQSGSLWCGVAHAALFRSDDGGATWTLNEALESHPTREAWQPGAGGLALHTIVPDAVNPERIFIGISAVGILRSDDGGRSWAVKNKGVEPVIPDETRKYGEIDRCVHKFVQDPTDPDRLYQQNHIGVFRSVDAGDTWERIETGLPSNFGFPMVMLPGKPRTLFVVPQEADFARMFAEGRAGVYRSDDAGDSWTRTDRGIEGPSWSGVLRNSMTVDREVTPGVYFGTTGGELYASFDEGGEWRRLPGRYPRIESLAAITR